MLNNKQQETKLTKSNKWKPSKDNFNHFRYVFHIGAFILIAFNLTFAPAANIQQQVVSYMNESIPTINGTLRQQAIFCHGALCHAQNYCGLSLFSGYSTLMKGGQKPIPGQFLSFMALVNKTGNERYPICGATLISNRHVLTAAHCVAGKSEDHVYELVAVQVDGFDDEYKVPYYKFSIDKVYVAKGFNHGTNDWAIITLKHDIDISNPFIRPACLPIHNRFVNMDSCVQIGIGASDNSGAQSGEVRYRHINLVNPVSCQHKLGPGYDPSILCARQKYDGSKRGKPCLGDSGGPILCKNIFNRWTVYGIASWRPKSGFCSDREIYFANVADVLPDILTEFTDYYKQYKLRSH